MKALKLFQVGNIWNCQRSVIHTEFVSVSRFVQQSNKSLILACSNCFLQENHVNLVHIESRKSKRRNSEFEIFVDCDSDHEQLKEIIQLLRKHVNVVEMDPPDNSCLLEEGETQVDRNGEMLSFKWIIYQNLIYFRNV